MRFLHVAALAILLAVPLTAQMKSGEPAPAKIPASMEPMLVPSHGSTLLGLFYLAAGAGPHPTPILLHGFPGYELDLDLAQTLRSNGWNVLVMHYRGSWGVKGEFSFHHAAEDADSQVAYVLNPANAQKYRVDTRRVIVIGHSMGGYMAASAAAHNPRVAAAVLISAWNIGADYESRRHIGSAPATVETEARWLGVDSNQLPLAGTSGEALAREIYQDQQGLNFLNLAPAIAPRPVFIITANEGLAPFDHALVESRRKAGDTRVTEQHFETDHSYSDKRAELSNAILEWTQANVPH
jgi:pimeloyl-ACP methyl ester carboxylesterase